MLAGKVYMLLWTTSSTACPLLVMGVCSELEQKVDKMAADLTKRQLEREATAFEYKRCVYECFCMTRHDINLLDYLVCPFLMVGAVSLNRRLPRWRMKFSGNWRRVRTQFGSISGE